MKTTSAMIVSIFLAGQVMPIHVSMARRGDPDPERTPTTLPVAEGIQWLATLDQGYKDAAKYQRPMLVIYGAEWCAPCRALHEELEKKDVKEKLAGWTLVHVDVDKQEANADAYSGAIPALRLLSSQGKKLAGREGYLPGADLIKWMRESVPAAIPVDPDLVGNTAPNAEAIGRLVKKLGDADASVRGSAASRLAPFSAACAPAVVEAFAKGNLRTRLAVMELFSAWKAPTGKIDPWQPESIDAAHLDALKNWAAGIKPPSTQPAALDAEQLKAVMLDLAQFLATSDPGEADVIASRLARNGPPLLPTVVEKEKQATSDRQRERLTALRFKLVATTSLSQQWPGGLDRLAATDLQTRHLAAEELSSRATFDEMPLLLELFSDPDPLVREISLAALERIGGKQGAAALVKLLQDPVANVRAAVLKQLAEAPTPEATDAVIKYVAGEKDNDLVVHAVRVLKAANTDEATKGLVGLLSHESWRVRAEAIDALADLALNNRGSPNKDAAEAISKRLDDPDAYVVGRALAAMKPLGRGLSEKTLGDLVAKRPELGNDILKMLMSDVGSSNNDAQSITAIRAMCKSGSAPLRAAAVVALGTMPQVNCEEEVAAALHDKVDTVRIAGAKALFEVMGGLLPKDGYIEKPSFFGIGGGRVKVEPAAWIADFRTGKGRPKWMEKLQPDLDPLLKSGDKNAQRSAALALLGFGRDEEAMPILLEGAAADPDARVLVSGALPWLPWEKTGVLFKALSSKETEDNLAAAISANLTITRDVRAADLLWSQLSDNRGAQAVDAVYAGLQAIYFNSENQFVISPDDKAEHGKELTDAARRQLTTGSYWQKTVALALLLAGNRDAAKDEAKKIYQDEKNSDALRESGMQVYLMSAEQAEGEKMAGEALASEKLPPYLQKVALKLLARGANDMNYLANTLWLRNSMAYEVTGFGRGQVRQVNVPAGVKADMLTPFLKSDDPEIAADAGYLLCLLGDKQGLPVVLQAWNKSGSSDQNLTKLLYTAIAAVDDDSQTPVLEQVYTSIAKQNYQLREFYWTIRSMHGPKILALRKKMRDEVGMEQLQ